MRIAHVITGLGTGGAEMMLKKVVSETAASCDHVVISLKDGGAVGKTLQGLGIPVIALGGKSGRFSLSLLIRLARELRAIEPDLVQAWMYHANLAVWVARFLLRGHWPLCWSVRCSIGAPSSIKWTTRLVINICAYLGKRTTSIIYNSHLACGHHENIGYPRARSLVIPNGFDTRAFVPDARAKERFRCHHAIPYNHVIIGHIARAQPLKDQRTLLLAAAKVLERAPNTIFILAGTGIPRLADAGNKNALLVEALGDRVLFLPQQDNVNELMAAFDIFVLSSIAEGFPNVLGEALSCGVPCVATDVGDCARIVGKQGIIVPPGDPGKLAAGILKLLAMPSDERRAWGLAGRARMEKDYSIRAVAQMYLACWKAAAKAAGQGVPCAE